MRLLTLLLLGCSDPATDSTKPVDTAPADDTPADADGDGYGAAVDCDDSSSAIHPGADELCDGLDDDCDGATDEDGGDPSYADADGDGWGDPATVSTACTPASDSVLTDGDCDDTDPAISPDAPELCNDTDDDCDGAIDEDGGQGAWFTDDDGDGYGDPTSVTVGCEAPAGTVPDATDCDDTAADVHPDAPETCDGRDEDCDDTIDEDAEGAPTWYADVDGDGVGTTDLAWIACDAPSGFVDTLGDCDDADPTRAPGLPERCDTADVDEDCDGLADDADPDVDTSTWSAFYLDADGDGAAGDLLYAGCDAPDGYLGFGSDCDDADASVSPSATEVCDGLDDDCDGLIDDADDSVDPASRSTWFVDLDGDGHGGGDTTTACDGTGLATVADDCADTDPSVHPGATEDCTTEADDDCDGSGDAVDALNCTTTWRDTDGDGYGGTAQCSCATSTTGGAEDCDEADPTIHPGAGEDCDGIDDDCDGLVDGADPDAAATTWYADDDGDGFGDATRSSAGCSAPDGYVADDEDCDDADPSVNPDALDPAFDGVDTDCDGASFPKACDDIYAQDALQDFELTMTDEDWQALQDDCTSGTQAYHPATFTWNGESASAQVRLRGNWTWTCGKLQFQISFNEDDSDGRFRGLRKIVLDAPWYDRTMLHERLAYPVFERLGLPYSCANSARLTINGEYYGLYANVEKLDHEYLERNFEEEDGNLYEAGTTLRTNEDTADTSDISAYQSATTIEEIEAAVNLDQATAEWAAEAMIPALDNYWAGVEINYYVYHDPGGKLVYLPYDLDLSFGDSVYGDGTPIWPDVDEADPITWQHTGWLKEPLVETVLADPTWCEVYVDHLAEARAAFDPDEMSADLDTWDAQIRDALDEDPHFDLSDADHEAAVVSLQSFLQERADFIDTWLATGGHCPATW